MTQKLYCYVDESGQDTRGILFVALAVVVDAERETLRARLSQLEFDSGKGLKKWTKSTLLQRRNYVEGLLEITEFTGKSYFSQFTGTTDYLCL